MSKNIFDKKLRRTTFLVIVGYLLMIFGSSQLSSESFKPQLSVGERIITGYDIDQKKKFLKIFFGKIFSRDEAVETLIRETITLNHAIKKGISISEQFLTEQIDIILNKSVGNKVFSDLMNDSLIENEVLYYSLKSNLFWNEFIKKEFSNSIMVSEKDIKEAKPQVTRVIPSRIKTSMIFIPLNLRGEKNTVRLVERLIKEIDSGANFSILAKRFSKATSSKNGGALGWRELSQFSGPIQSQLKKTNIGELTNPLKFSDGIYLFKVEDRQNKLKPKEIEMYVEFGVIESFKNPKMTCANIRKSELIGPSLIKDLEKPIQLILKRMKVNDVQPYKEKLGIILCRKEPNLSTEERKKLEEKIYLEKVNKFGEGLYMNLRQHTVVKFYE